MNTDLAPTYEAEIVYSRRRADRAAGVRWLSFVCPRCGRRHRHGWPADEPAPIHRVKHCHGLGYWLAPDSGIAKRIEPQLKEAAREKQRAAGGDKKSPLAKNRFSPTGEKRSDDGSGTTDKLIAEAGGARRKTLSMKTWRGFLGGMRALEKIAEKRQEIARVEGGKKAGRGRPLGCSPTGERPKPIHTDAAVADAAGMGHQKYDQLEAVLESGDEELQQAVLPEIDVVKALRPYREQIAAKAKEKQQATLRKGNAAPVVLKSSQRDGSSSPINTRVAVAGAGTTNKLVAEAAREKQRAAGEHGAEGGRGNKKPSSPTGEKGLDDRSGTTDKLIAKTAGEKQREAGEHGVEGGRGRKKNPWAQMIPRVRLLVSGGRSTGPSMTSSTPVHREQHCHGLGYWLQPGGEP